MSQFDYIKEIARFGLENDQESLMSKLNELIEHSKKTKKVNFAIQLQSILKESLAKQKTSGLTKFGSDAYHQRIEDKELSDIILEKLTSDYSLDNLVAEDKIIEQLHFFLKNILQSSFYSNLIYLFRIKSCFMAHLVVEKH